MGYLVLFLALVIAGVVLFRLSHDPTGIPGTVGYHLLPVSASDRAILERRSHEYRDVAGASAIAHSRTTRTVPIRTPSRSTWIE